MELLVNATTVGNQQTPSMCPLDGKTFVVAWADNDRVQGRVMNVDGRNLTDEFSISTEAAIQSFPAITGRLNGTGFVAAWIRTKPGTVVNDVNVQIFKADGSAVLPQAIVPTSADVDGRIPPVAMGPLQQGRFAVAWVRDNPRALIGEVFDKDGTSVGRMARTNESGRLGSGIAGTMLTPDGAFALAFIDIVGLQKREVRLQVFNPDGSASGSEITVNGRAEVFDGPLSISQTNEGFVVGWISKAAPEHAVVTFKRFRRDGTSIESGPAVNLTDDAAKENARQPVLRGLAKGGFIAVWADNTGDPIAQTDIARRVVASNGEFGPKDRLNDTTVGDQVGPAVASLIDHVAVAWTDRSQTAPDTSGLAVRATIFKSPGS